MLNPWQNFETEDYSNTTSSNISNVDGKKIVINVISFVLFPLPDSDSDSCTMHDFSIGLDSDTNPSIEIFPLNPQQ